MAKDLCDEVTVIDGEKTWPQEFSWPLIGQHFHRGYEESSGDFVIHLDSDFLFHERDFGLIRLALSKFSDAPAVSFWKYQFIQPDRYNLKSRLVIAVNKGKYGDRIRFDSGGDLCQPSLDGNEIKPEHVPQAGVPFYNYEKLLKTKEQIMDDVGRMDRAYKKHFGKYVYGKDGSDESAYDGWINMVIGRNRKPQNHIPLSEHPKYIQETIRNLKPENFGYDGFGLLEKNDYIK